MDQHIHHVLAPLFHLPEFPVGLPQSLILSLERQIFLLQAGTVAIATGRPAPEKAL
jgi:hypothetical protein